MTNVRWPSSRRATLIAIAILGGLLTLPTDASSADLLGGLARRGVLGTKLRPASDELREQNKLAADAAVEVEDVLPGSAAEAAGLRSGDLVLSIDGNPVTTPALLVNALTGKKAGAQIRLDLARNGEKLTKQVALKPASLESSDDFDVVYDSVTSRGARLRTIVTVPRTKEASHPALFLIQGVGMASVDNPAGPLASYKLLVDELTRLGFVTLRVDKPGCGDSEGGPTDEVDFDTELDGYRAALTALKANPSVDPKRIFLFGHSMGGVMAPLLAKESPVRGIVVYGTVSKTWTEYMLENFRRQMELAGDAPGHVDEVLRKQAAVQHYLNAERVSPAEVGERHADLKDVVAELFPDGRTFVGRTYKFFQQLSDKNLGYAWQECTVEVLAVWGTADFVSARDDHERIAQIVNQRHPGRGTFVALEGSDHGFARSASPRDSQSQRVAWEYNPAFMETLKAWVLKRSTTIDETARDKP